MKPRIPIALPIALIVLLALGSLQGGRIDTIRESESFYRWVVSASTLTRLGDLLEPDISADLPDPMDEELFAQLDEIAESLLPDYPIDDEYDLNTDGTVRSRLLRAVRQSEDQDIWDLLREAEVQETLAQFRTYLAANQIQSMGTQFSTSSLYGDASSVQGVGLTSMFFGFRKLAANLLWIQVDSFWHSGEMHRMLPIMRTCVAFDPNFVDAYLLGSWHLAYNIPAKIELTPEPLKKFNPRYNKRLGLREEWYYLGAEFLRDGIRKNPRDYRLYFDLGYSIYEQKLHDHANAVLYLDEARRHKHDRWVPRMLYRSLSLNGQYEDAIAGWEDYLLDFPNNVSAPRLLLKNRGYLADAIADEALECMDLAEAAKTGFQQALEAARKDGLGSEIDRLREEISKANAFILEMDGLNLKEKDKAMDVWLELSTYVGETVSKGRIMRRNALNYLEEGRDLEAISELQIVRWEDLENFDNFNELIIKIKQDADIPLSVSEQLQVLRVADAEQYLTEEDDSNRIYRIECPYRSMNA